MLSGQAANFFLQAGYFIIVARLLGVFEYGVFAGAFALVNIVTPYSALGYGMLFMRYVSVDHSRAGTYWGNTILTTSCMSVLFAAALFFVGPLLSNIRQKELFVVIVLANCLFGQMSTLASGVFQTFEKMRASAILSFFTNLCRFISVLAAKVCLGHASALEWSVALLIGSVCGAVISYCWVRREIGPVTTDFKLVLKRTQEGLGFAFAGTTQGVYNDVDKAMLSHYGLTRENGFYTLAYRVVDFATTPIAAIDLAVLPRIFRIGNDDLRHVFRLAVRATAIACGVGVLTALCIAVTAPLIPYLVGHGFTGVISALRCLCWIPLLRAVHRLSGSILTGSGRQQYRTLGQFVVAGINLVLNMWWIPTYGWIGAAWSSVASDGLLAVANSLMVLALWRRIRLGFDFRTPQSAESSTNG
jgi:O-antigen/teichoic acid export membrane protein